MADAASKEVKQEVIRSLDESLGGRFSSQAGQALNHLDPANPKSAEEAAQALFKSVTKNGTDAELFKEETVEAVRKAIGIAFEKEGSAEAKAEAEKVLEAWAKTQRELVRKARPRVVNSAQARDEASRTFKHGEETGRPVTIETPKGDREVWVKGEAQSTDEAENHLEMVRQLAGEAMEHPDAAAVFIDRPLTEALAWIKGRKDVSQAQIDALDDAISKLNAIKVPKNDKAALLKTPVKEPDVVLIRRTGEGKYEIDITEVVSVDSQTDKELRARIKEANKLLPPDMVGTPDAVIPTPKK